MPGIVDGLFMGFDCGINSILPLPGSCFDCRLVQPSGVGGRASPCKRKSNIRTAGLHEGVQQGRADMPAVEATRKLAHLITRTPCSSYSISQPLRPCQVTQPGCSGIYHERDHSC